MKPDDSAPTAATADEEDFVELVLANERLLDWAEVLRDPRVNITRYGCTQGGKPWTGR
jgi:hypothetical protein